jgi:protocatechuate 3,4-dioxygenase beta subunit
MRWTASDSRLIPQMYFPGDPLFAYDPVMNSVTDERARRRMIASFDPDAAVDQWATGYRWDLVLRRTLIAEPTADGVHFDIRLQGENETVFFDV